MAWKDKMSNKCEHLQVRISPGVAVGSCRCETCGKVMPLSVGLNCLLDAMRKSIGELKTITTLPKDEHFVSMVIHNGRVYVASTDGVYILEDEYLRKLKLVTGE